jgi:hypothetical protein
MTTNRTIAMGAFLWTALGVDLWLHAAMNDYLALVVAGVGAIAWTAVFFARRSAVVGALAAVKVLRRP